jgi:hypothetical protein
MHARGRRSHEGCANGSSECYMRHQFEALHSPLTEKRRITENEEPEIRVRHAELIAINVQPPVGIRGLRTFPAPYISVQLSDGTFRRQ